MVLSLRRTLQSCSKSKGREKYVRTLDPKTDSPSLSRTLWASLIAQLVKNLPAMQETLVRFLGQEDLLEKGQAVHSSILWLPWWLSW